jgi:dTDP-4-dehydrorhamnose 3,5-epimerase
VNVIHTDLPGVLILEPRVFADDRGFFLESYNKRIFREATGVDLEFVQDNHSASHSGVLRGLHYQIRQPQGKLVRVLSGKVFDVAVDLRRGSASFGKWVGFYLDADSKRMAWIPPGFAHGFLVLSDVAEFFYKTTHFYSPADERVLLWNDPDLRITWPLQKPPILAPKDAKGTDFARAEVYD